MHLLRFVCGDPAGRRLPELRRQSRLATDQTRRDASEKSRLGEAGPALSALRRRPSLAKLPCLPERRRTPWGGGMRVHGDYYASGYAHLEGLLPIALAQEFLASL